MQNQLKQFALGLGADIIGFCQLPVSPIPELPTPCRLASSFRMPS